MKAEVARRWFHGFAPMRPAGWVLLAAWLGVVVLAWSRPQARADFADPFNLEAVGFRLSVNAADADRLVALHGIGPALARRIVDHRDAHGPFANLSELEDVSGIGPRTAARIAPWLRLD